MYFCAMPKILVIDDEKSIRRALREILEFEKHSVEEAEDGQMGLNKITSENFDAILCDVKMPKIDGLELLQKISEQNIETPLIMMSGHATVETAVEAVKKGAYDFLLKPIDLNRLLVTLRNALDKQHLVSETKILRKKISKGTDMIGSSKAIEEVKKMIDKVAPTDARVLITGPNGSGKELVARQLHEKSNRSKMPFIEVNCAAIPSELIESELFGHEKGAFTSAVATRKGKFELAEGGTLFLDEIGDMSLSAQAKVLRALQENKITRVGGDKAISVNVRIVAATNKNLQQEIEKDHFREDLFHRLSVIPICVPALAERKEDIPLLTEYFMNLICTEQGGTAKTFSEGAIKALQQLPWTGNIREFRNVIERLIILCDKIISDKDVKKYTSTN